MDAIFLLIVSASLGISASLEYYLGAFIALFLLGYLGYSLIKPEKF
jgi:K+-transporting ATPase KdpF subunit